MRGVHTHNVVTGAWIYYFVFVSSALATEPSPYPFKIAKYTEYVMNKVTEDIDTMETHEGYIVGTLQSSL